MIEIDHISSLEFSRRKIFFSVQCDFETEGLCDSLKKELSFLRIKIVSILGVKKATTDFFEFHPTYRNGFAFSILLPDSRNVTDDRISLVKEEIQKLVLFSPRETKFRNETSATTSDLYSGYRMKNPIPYGGRGRR